MVDDIVNAPLYGYSCHRVSDDLPSGEHLPVVGEQPIAQHEPSPLVALQVVGPFEEPSFVGVRAGAGRSAREDGS